MFSTQHPRSTSRRRAVAGGLVAAATAAALTLLVPGTASAAESGESYAEGQFLGGTLLGGDLASVAELDGAYAANNGTQSTQTSKDPLQVTALQTVTVGNGDSVQVGQVGDSGVQAGAVSQYAQASSDGSATGASGAISSDGAIGVGSDQSAPLGTTTIDLSGALGSQFTDAISDLHLEIDAIAAQAQASLSGTTSDYRIDGARLVIDSPELASIDQDVSTAVAAVQSQLDALESTDGPLGAELSNLLAGLNPALNILGTDGNLSISIDAGDLTSLVQRVLADSYQDGSVSFDFENGRIVIDLDGITGGLNNLPANTEILTDDQILPILQAISDSVAGLADNVVDTVTGAVNDATVRISADVDSDIAQAPVVQEVCHTVTEVVQVPTQVLDGLLGPVTQLVEQTVDTLVCEDQSVLQDPLHTTLNLDIVALLDDLVGGTASSITANAQVLSVPVSLDTGLVLDDLGQILGGALFGDGGSVSELADTLQSTVVTPAVQTLLGDSDSMGVALTDALSILVNVQEVGPYTPRGESPELGQAVGGLGGLGTMRMAGESLNGFTETAMRIGVLNGAAGGLATVNLASATVAAAGVGGDGGDCTGAGCDGGGGDCVVDCGTGGDGGGYTTTGSLAYTGVGISILIAILLALMAAGAYLVRESYRRRRAESQA